MNGLDCEPRNPKKQGSQHKKNRAFRKEGSRMRKETYSNFDEDNFGKKMSNQKLGRALKKDERDQAIMDEMYSPGNLSPIGKKMMGMQSKEEDDEEVPNINDPSTWPDMGGPMDHDFEEDES